MEFFYVNPWNYEAVFPSQSAYMSNLKVFKFGGASVKDAAAIRHVANILQDYKDEKMVIIVSAMGKTTNALEKIVAAYVNQTGTAFELLEEVKKAHYQTAAELFGESHPIFNILNDTFVEIEWVIEDEPQDGYDYIYDQIVSIGEMASSRLLATWLTESGMPAHWLDARDAIRTDDTFREGKVDWAVTNQQCQRVVPPLLEKQNFVVTQGFIGGTQENFTTTLGREGSDFTAAIFSYALDAESMSIWKDVPGILTGDPRLFDNVAKIDRLSYKEAIEMTYYGAKVIHPKTIKPLENKNIPLHVKSFVDPKGEGTIIMSDVNVNYPPVVVVEKNQVLIHISTKDFSFVAESHLAKLFQLFDQYRIKINMMQNMAISFTVCVTERSERLKQLVAELKKEFNVVVDQDLELITVRHYEDEIVKNLSKGKMVLFEEYIRGTMSMVVKNIPNMVRKETAATDKN